MRPKLNFYSKRPSRDLDQLEGLVYAIVGGLAANFFLDTISLLSGSAKALFTLLLLIGCFNVFYVLIIAFKPRPSRKSIDLIALVSVLVLAIVIFAAGRFVSFSIAGALKEFSGWHEIPETCFYYAIPFASAPLLLQLVLGWEYSLILILSLSFTAFNFLGPQGEIFFLYIVSTSYVGCRALSRVRSRTDYFKAGLGIIAMAMVVVNFSWLDSPDLSYQCYFIQLLSAILGGIFCVLIISGFAPVLEVLGGYVTDLRLIEMATLDHPVLKELSIQAPGTWNHSMVMGNMAEVAAEAVGANPVLSRVGAYFHDIGKSKKPLYFVENQFGGENRHDRLSPSMSALIIKSHVKEGLEIAKKHGLPEPIQDLISQHHGTSLISFFYEKALKEAGGEAEIDRTNYEYPGPKPQTKEAGIMMLADGIEAASRTIAEPTFDRIQGMVQKMINKVFASGQLDECDLTLRDLHEIARCFTRVLSSIYHQRVSYSEPADKNSSGSRGTTDKQKNGSEKVEDEPLGDLDRSAGRSTERESGSGSSSGKENLRRLGVE